MEKLRKKSAHIQFIRLFRQIYNFVFQLLPAAASLDEDIYNDKSLVCSPVIKVSGQTTPFLEAVHVELTYSNDDVANIEHEFLPVGNKIKFSTEYGLLIRHEETESKCQKINEKTDVFIERPRNDQVKFSFSLKHFCKYVQIHFIHASICKAAKQYTALPCAGLYYIAALCRILSYLILSYCPNCKQFFLLAQVNFKIVLTLSFPFGLGSRLQYYRQFKQVCIYIAKKSCKHVYEKSEIKNRKDELHI